jgi:hypothetical protein
MQRAAQVASPLHDPAVTKLGIRVTAGRGDSTLVEFLNVAVLH